MGRSMQPSDGWPFDSFTILEVRKNWGSGISYGSVLWYLAKKAERKSNRRRGDAEVRGGKDQLSRLKIFSSSDLRVSCSWLKSLAVP
jgi:hypothetical protein